MTRQTTAVMPTGEKILFQLGENIRLARLRRDFTLALVSERAGITPKTLAEIEKGSGKVQIGLYLNVLFILGLQDDFKNIAANDEFGRKLQDIGLMPKLRASAKTRGRIPKEKS